MRYPFWCSDGWKKISKADIAEIMIPTEDVLDIATQYIQLNTAA